jgi:hypothetical protein
MNSELVYSGNMLQRENSRKNMELSIVSRILQLYKRKYYLED